MQFDIKHIYMISIDNFLLNFNFKFFSQEKQAIKPIGYCGKMHNFLLEIM